MFTRNTSPTGTLDALAAKAESLIQESRDSATLSQALREQAELELEHAGLASKQARAITAAVKILEEAGVVI